MSDESNKKKQPPKPDPAKEGETYSLYVFAGKLTDEQFEELVELLGQIAHRGGKPDSEN